MTDTSALTGRLEEVARDRGMTTGDLINELIHRVGDFADQVAVDRLTDDILSRLRTATTTREHADRDWRALVAEAGALPISRGIIAIAAGCSKQWVSELARARTNH